MKIWIKGATSPRMESPRHDYWSIDDATDQAVSWMKDNLSQGIEDFELEINKALDRPKFWRTLDEKVAEAGISYDIKKSDKSFDDHYYYMYLGTRDTDSRR